LRPQNYKKVRNQRLIRLNILPFGRIIVLLRPEKMFIRMTMNKKFIFAALLVMCCACSKHEKLLIGATGQQQIAIIDKESGEVEWTYTLATDEVCNDLDINKKGEVVYAYGRGAKLIKRDGTTVWDFKAGANEAVYAVNAFKSGGYMVGVAGRPARIVELDNAGATVKEIKFNTATADIERQFRHIAKTPQNTYIVPFTYKHKVSELDENGRYIKSVMCSGMPVDVELDLNGKWVVACGDASSIIIINPETKKIDNTIETASLNWGALNYVADVAICKNGNTLIANSNEGTNDHTQPLLLEVDTTGHIAWRMPFVPTVNDATSVRLFYE
jgi:hypothetical protein